MIFIKISLKFEEWVKMNYPRSAPELESTLSLLLENYLKLTHFSNQVNMMIVK